MRRSCGEGVWGRSNFDIYFDKCRLGTPLFISPKSGKQTHHSRTAVACPLRNVVVVAPLADLPLQHCNWFALKINLIS